MLRQYKLGIYLYRYEYLKQIRVLRNREFMAEGMEIIRFSARFVVSSRVHEFMSSRVHDILGR